MKNLATLISKIKKYIVPCLLIVSLGFNISLLRFHRKTEMINITKEDFMSLVDLINNDFSVSDYVEILYKDNVELIMIPPQEAADLTLLDRSKVFCYKSTTKNVLIMLAVSYSSFPVPSSEEWFASFDYTTKLLNNPDRLSGYNPQLPSIFLCSNSFRYSGIYYTMTCFSDCSSDILAQNELTKFSNSLLSYIKGTEKREENL